MKFMPSFDLLPGIFVVVRVNFRAPLPPWLRACFVPLFYLRLLPKLAENGLKQSSINDYFTLTSRSKLNKSPGIICVSTSAPVFAGTKSGVTGLSIHASVWHVTSLSSMLSVISSRYNSVWTGWWRRPSTGGGDFERCSNSDCRLRASRARRFSAFRCKSTGCS